MSITKTDVEKIALLANLELTEEEKERFTQQMGAIVAYFDKLNELDTSDVEPMMHSSLSGDHSGSQRDDAPQAPLGQKIALGNAPHAGEGHFKVPRIL
jgi:aspartyl-tRNA(Asn)/glutamyl-tRNA(Gln) amidotransferase subunit C